jgi:hypothetical protein
MAGWPKTWAGMPEDLLLGNDLIDNMLPFVAWLLESGLAPSTTRRHVGNLWVLGGHIIRMASIHGERGRPAEEFLAEAASPFDGPLVSDLSESEQKSLDATCRKLYRFRETRHGECRTRKTNRPRTQQ